MTLSRSELEALIAIDIREPLADTDLKAALSSPPFLPIRLINFRDLGAIPGSSLPEGRFYRCGDLGFAKDSPETIAWLSTHVKRIFDLRKASERSTRPSPEIPGVENVWLEQEGNYTSPSLKEFALGDGSETWRVQYMMVLDVYKPIIRAILEHVRDQPAEPIVFHCTAGRDRTGVVAGLLQSLAGTSVDDVIFDFLLSRIGTEVARERLTAFALSSVGASDPTTPGFWNLASLKSSYWTAFLGGIQESYGDWDGYVTKGLGFSEEDLETIKKNLRG